MCACVCRRYVCDYFRIGVNIFMHRCIFKHTHTQVSVSLSQKSTQKHRCRNHLEQHQGLCFEMLSRQLSPFTAYSSIFIHIFIHLRHATYLSTYTTLSMAAETTVSSTRARVLRCYQGSFVRSLFFSCLESCYQGSFVRGRSLPMPWKLHPWLFWGLHSSPSSDISESVFCIASGQHAKSKFDWEQETPQKRSAASTAESLHSGALPRLDTSGFQMPDHYSARRRARESSNHISLLSLKNPKTKNISCKLLQKIIINKSKIRIQLKKIVWQWSFSKFKLKVCKVLMIFDASW